MQEFSGKLNGQNYSFGIVVARFNELITKKLLEGCLEGLERHGVEKNRIAISWVPGAFEVPVVAKRMAESSKYDAVICLGAIIKGSTSHFDYVSSQAAAGVAHTALHTGIPAIFGILTTDTIEQALERAGTKMGNKGFEAAQAAIEMADVLHQLKKAPKTSAQKFAAKARV